MAAKGWRCQKCIDSVPKTFKVDGKGNPMPSAVGQKGTCDRCNSNKRDVFRVNR